MSVNVSTVSISVIEARGLRAADHGLTAWGTSDPYLLVCSGKGLIGKDSRTKVVSKNCNPKWNETFEHQFDYTLTRFKFVVMDKDRFTRDDRLGKVVVPIEDFYSLPMDSDGFRTMGKWFDLKMGKSSKWRSSKGKKLGAIYLRIRVCFNIHVAAHKELMPVGTGAFTAQFDWKRAAPKSSPLVVSLLGIDGDNKIVVHADNGPRPNLFMPGMDLQSIRIISSDTKVSFTVKTNALPKELRAFVLMLNSENLLTSDLKSISMRLLGSQNTSFNLHGMPGTSGMLFGLLVPSDDAGWSFVSMGDGVNGSTASESFSESVHILHDILARSLNSFVQGAQGGDARQAGEEESLGGSKRRRGDTWIEPDGFALPPSNGTTAPVGDAVPSTPPLSTQGTVAHSMPRARADSRGSGPAGFPQMISISSARPLQATHSLASTVAYDMPAVAPVGLAIAAR
jgi:hypothetical protein